jgi:uncharacterized protein (DUF2249 family)
MTTATGEPLHLASVPAADRERVVLERFDGLDQDASFVIVSPTDVRPIFDRLHGERDDRLGWYPIAGGPAQWRVTIARLKPKESEPAIGEYFARDHDEIDVLFGHLRADVAVGAPAARLIREFDEFNARLERHIRWEEVILFPAVEAKSPMLAQGPGRVMRMEHQDIRQWKAAASHELRAAPPSLARAAEALGTVLQILLDHNRKEEHVYYPMSDEIFRSEEAADLLRRVRELR